MVTLTAQQLVDIYEECIRILDDTRDIDADGAQTLLTRDALVSASLTAAQQTRLDKLDAELLAKWRTLAEILPNPNFQDRRHWWWFLHEGPQVRNQVLQVA